MSVRNIAQIWEQQKRQEVESEGNLDDENQGMGNKWFSMPDLKVKKAKVS